MRLIRRFKATGNLSRAWILLRRSAKLRVKHDFSSNWHLVVGALNQLSDRNINTAVNQLIDNNGNYKSYLANSFSSLAPRFHVDSDLAYLTGRFKTGTYPPRRGDRKHGLQVRVLFPGHQPCQDRTVYIQHAAGHLSGEHRRSAG